jgi:hypothetical protein
MRAKLTYFLFTIIVTLAFFCVGDSITAGYALSNPGTQS